MQTLKPFFFYILTILAHFFPFQTPLYKKKQQKAETSKQQNVTFSHSEGTNLPKVLQQIRDSLQIFI